MRQMCRLGIRSLFNMENLRLYLTSMVICACLVIIATETDVTYRGQKAIRNKNGDIVNRARWELTPTKLERPDVKQNCQVVRRQSGLDADGSESDSDETLLRCSTDDEAPKIADCPAIVSSSTNPGLAIAVVTWPAPTAVDNTDPNPAVSCTPAAGYEFVIGITEIVCEAVDINGNRATCGFSVNVTDNEAPQIAPCPLSFLRSTDSGLSTTVVNWNDPTAVDNSDPNPAVSCTPASGSKFTIGITEVVCEAFDINGNRAKCGFSVNVTDDEAPKMSPCPVNVSQSTDTGYFTALVNWNFPTADDNADTNIVVECTPSPGSKFTVGSQQVVCKATDSSGNEAACHFNVRITDVECKEHYTNGTGVEFSRNTKYDFVWPRVPLNTNRFSFSLLGLGAPPGDAYLILSPTDQPPPIAIPIIIIGGWGNAQSAVLCDASSSNEEWVTVSTPNITSASETRDFYVSFPGGNTLEVGRVGEQPFISHQMECTVEVKYIGIASAWSRNNRWTFCGFGNDCHTLRSLHGYQEDGPYKIYLSLPGVFVDMYCDMNTDDHGWIVFQKRFDGSVDFNRTWANYTNGFGSQAGEFWWGLDKLQSLTSQGSWRLRVDLEDWEGITAYAEYDMFRIHVPHFTLSIGPFLSGSAGDALTLQNQNGLQFTTLDKDNDRHDTLNCAVHCNGGGWHRSCCRVSNLNGKYYNTSEGTKSKGLRWKTWRPNNLKAVQMKLRRNI